ncbi:hypothetical protein G4G28_06060 [Massilia sp. Dwa41.01b]|nr:hypothetical protein [Massilia sp. Se16.2.3]QNA88167.1 hypothetical protein G4G28_06060 [Massilia sp. Dwa41.01b]QNA99073.1 hypothetical protein G4G31_09785 [Massilia sp. Se16.2.3]
MNIARMGLFICSLCFLLVSCGNRPTEEKQLLGSWSMQGRESACKANTSVSLAKLILEKNGLFKAVNLPAEILPPVHPALEAGVDGTGNWKLSKSTNGLEVVDFVFEKSVQLKGSLPYAIRMFLLVEGESKSLAFYCGDPDTDPRIDFVKDSR